MPAHTQKTLNPVLEEKFQLVLQTIKAYPDQVRQAWEEVGALEVPPEFQTINNVVVSGMGGSALGARIIDSLIVDRIRIPLEIFNDYHLPNYANEKTLVIAYSYSGGTEETISAANEALNKKCQVFGVTTGDKLADFLEKENLPRYIFNPINNPSKKPRMGLGYAIGIILGLFSKINLITVSKEEVDEAIVKMQEAIEEYGEDRELSQNLAKSFARKIYGRVPILIASEHLVGCAYAIKNMLNESAKTFCALFDLPEANHHLMEGLGKPDTNKKVLYFLFFNSNLYSDKVKKRYPLTAEVVGKNGIEYGLYSPFPEKKLSQIFSTLVFGSFIAYYLTKEYAIDPLETPWVDYFKEKLSGL